MNEIPSRGFLFVALTSVSLFSLRCGTQAPYSPPSAGATSTGGAQTTTGGSDTGGTTGGSSDTGGTSTGGTTGGTSTGGDTATGGVSTGGTFTGGASSGGASSGGSATGGGAGSPSGGTAGGSTGGASGGGGTDGGGDAGGAPTQWEQVVSILETHCGNACHYQTATPPKVYLRNGDGMLYMRLTTAITTAIAEKCAGRVLVDKATPANSLLAQIIMGKVTDTANNCTVEQMPLGSALGAPDVQIITNWINAGAPQ
ncbi:MAG TPA: hypothetical protein VG937_01425 [Polyangiaceae bacterium]|jgi:hypothetical protein|nr:hypothetical protein [Polyangiaceae bacterium]